jgi:peptide deformylase
VISSVDDEVRQLADDLLETMYADRGIGLAATQVDIHRRVVVVDVSDTKDSPLVLVNPEVVALGPPCMSEESCLSLPGLVDVVERAYRVTVRALGRDGTPFQLEAEGPLAVCLQHEVEHLEGRLFVDHLSWLKRLRVRGTLRAAARRRGSTGATAP